jgi:hypothetical protein
MDFFVVVSPKFGTDQAIKLLRAESNDLLFAAWV